VTQLERARASVVMNIKSPTIRRFLGTRRVRDRAGSRAVRPRAAMWGATMETQCPVEDPVRNAPLSQLGQECPVIDWGSYLRDVIGEN